MCGIAGYIGKNQIDRKKIDILSRSMKNRGPDNFSYFHKVCNDNSNIYLFHSRLSIIDLEERSNQPFKIGNFVLIFNGEIYNYLELRNNLISEGYIFKTNSDTEVLLQYYIKYGKDCVQYFEGMWTFAILNTETNDIFLSRDRFGEKPLYIYEDNNGFYFFSETKYLKSILKNKIEINPLQIGNYLNNGYKSLNKKNQTFYKNILKIESGSNILINYKKELKKETFFNPKYQPNNKLSLQDCIEQVRALLIDSMKFRIRSDVPLAFCLSGGIDSSSLVSIASKKLNCEFKTFSILDSDERYNEKDNMDATVKDLSCNHEYIYLSHDDVISNLQKLINYHDAPVATISYYIQSLLYKEVSKQGFKVSISGTAADEIFTGYYDHFLFHLNQIKHSNHFKKNLEYWKKYIYNYVRNPLLKNPDSFIENPKFREHIYDKSELLENYLINIKKDNFFEKNFSEDILRNRMLNELFYETTPLILNEDDLNAMFFSIENRSPYLDKNLFEFSLQIPSEYLIQNGYGKYILRESMKNILNDHVRLDRRKRGFNASINSMINFSDNKIKEYLLDKNSKIFDYINLKKIEKLFYLDVIPNHYSKFLFSFINAKIFLDTEVI